MVTWWICPRVREPMVNFSKTLTETAGLAWLCSFFASMYGVFQTPETQPCDCGLGARIEMKYNKPNCIYAYEKKKKIGLSSTQENQTVAPLEPLSSAPQAQGDHTGNTYLLQRKVHKRYANNHAPSYPQQLLGYKKRQLNGRSTTPPPSPPSPCVTDSTTTNGVVPLRHSCAEAALNRGTFEYNLQYLPVRAAMRRRSSLSCATSGVSLSANATRSFSAVAAVVQTAVTPTRGAVHVSPIR